MSLESIYLHQTTEDTIIADFSSGVNRLLIDDLDFGFALKQTLKVLNITPDIQNPRRMRLRGTTHDVASYVPWLEEMKYRIPAQSSVEQTIYQQGRAQEIRDDVSAALDQILTTLPGVVVSGEFVDVCQTILEPFAQTVLAPDSELSVVHGVAAVAQLTTH
jgi:hypothetical protein